MDLQRIEWLQDELKIALLSAKQRAKSRGDATGMLNTNLAIGYLTTVVECLKAEDANDHEYTRNLLSVIMDEEEVE